MVNSIILTAAAVVFIVAAGLFAGAETGMYQLSRLRLRLGIEKKQLSYIILAKAMDDSPGFLLSMLIGTNLAEYFATGIVTLMLLGRTGGEHTAELFATFITAPTLFVFSELVPKNIFFYRADSLMPSLATVLFAFRELFTWSGVAPLLKFLSRGFVKLTGTPLSAETVISDAREHHIKAILRETREEAFLSPVQTEIINRVVTIQNIRIRSVMTPINKVQMVARNSDNSVLLNILEKCAFTRLAVYEGQPANIVGFIDIYEALTSGGEFRDLQRFIRPIRELSADTPVIEAMNVMQRENQKIVLVTRAGHAGRERPLGIVTMKDLVEEVVGELAEW
ncbi:MAG TPA: CNNM domain-containing protein [Sedimentisphaerales bacterium]|nr:CNNM domain-containing protein [Sedimentisphaerales bacterium]